MSYKIKNIKDVVEWGLCIGCGVCYYACKNNAIQLKNIDSLGIRPLVDKNKCSYQCECLSVCPGYTVDASLVYNDPGDFKQGNILFGPALEIWEGYATDPEIRYAGSSGGVLTALALYCLEMEKMKFTLHSGADLDEPLQNKTYMSYHKEDLLKRTGSRYAPASPCDSLVEIEKSDKPCVFIGKPCDTTAIAMVRKQNPELNKNLGLVLTFFCAGAPSIEGTKYLLNQMNIPVNSVDQLRYRGLGWPGSFKVIYYDDDEKLVSYKESWHELQKYRSFRCHLCPDGIGEIADISCGDAWHKYSQDNNSGVSLIIIRNERGKLVFTNAVKNGYIKAERVGYKEVIKAQGLLQRKPQIFGRFIALKMFNIPIPSYRGFYIFKTWINTSIQIKFKTIFGTIKRIIKRKLYKRRVIE